MDDERSLLEVSLDGTPPDNISPDSPSLWSKAMGRILVGIVLESWTLRFWGLDLLLPVWGHILYLLGLRTLRRENRAFRACWYVTLVQTGLWAFSLLHRAAPGWQSFYAAPPGLALTYLGLLLPMVQLFCLRRGLRAVRSGAGLSPGGGALIVLLLWQAVLLLLAVSGGSGKIQIGIFGFLLLLAVYAWTIRCLRRSYREVDGTGIVSAPVRLPDWLLAGAVVGGLLAGIAVVGLTCDRLPMAWQPGGPVSNGQADAVKERLLSLGFPEDVLDDLSTEDLLTCAGAVQVVSDAQRHAMTSRKVDEAFPRPLLCTNVAVELEEDHWRIFHHFRWEEGTRFYGADALQLWPVSRHMDGWSFIGPYTGRVLCRQNGADLWAPYYFLGEEIYTSSSIFFGTHTATDCFASFSFPRQGERCRGYVTYEAISIRTGYLFDSWANYAHAMERFQYPALSGHEWLKTGGMISDEEPFYRVQNALQFLPEAKQ